MERADNGLAFMLRYENIAWYEDGKVHIKCSPVDRIIFSQCARCGKVECNDDYSPVTEAEFDVVPEYGYFRLTVIDEKGKHACTNAYFPEDL